MILSQENSEGTAHSFSQSPTLAGTCNLNRPSEIGDILLAPTATANNYMMSENWGTSN